MLARLRKDWESSVYGFYKPEVQIKLGKDGCRGHEFHCSKAGCNTKITQWLDKADSRSTRNLHKHTKKCWGPEVLQAADGLKEEDVWSAVAAFVRLGSIRAFFAIQNRAEKRTYSARQHTRSEIW